MRKSIPFDGDHFYFDMTGYIGVICVLANKHGLQEFTTKEIFDLEDKSGIKENEIRVCLKNVNEPVGRSKMAYFLTSQKININYVTDFNPSRQTNTINEAVFKIFRDHDLDVVNDTLYLKVSTLENVRVLLDFRYVKTIMSSLYNTQSSTVGVLQKMLEEENKIALLSADNRKSMEFSSLETTGPNSRQFLDKVEKKVFFNNQEQISLSDIIHDDGSRKSNAEILDGILGKLRKNEIYLRAKRYFPNRVNDIEEGTSQKIIKRLNYTIETVNLNNTEQLNLPL